MTRTDPLRARLVELAYAGDEDARACLLEALPATLPPRVAVHFRDREIRAVALWLRTRAPTISDRQLARLLELTGDRLTAGRAMPKQALLAHLTMDDCIVLWRRLEPIATHDRRWPRERMLRNILAEKVGNNTPVEAARAAA
jgi:hypothetical protein